MKSAILNLINNDQTGFIKGRFIGENIHHLESVICFTKENKIPGLNLFLDFEKAFDTLEWTFIRKTLEHFGFSKGIIIWINLFFYLCLESCVLTDGRAIPLTYQEVLDRAVLSRLTCSFLLSAEVLAKAIRKTKKKMLEFW